MASDNEASCVSDPNFAVICSFLECFGKSCGIEYPDIALLQEMVENAQEVPQQLIDLHVKLLRKTRKTVSVEKWERALVKFCHTYSNQDGWELERFGYKKARIAVKLRLLKVLLEAQFDLNQRFKNEVNKLAATELRVEPLGRDKSGLAYWCQLDEGCNIRVYREDLDEESWQLVAKDRDGVVNLISTLSNGEAGDIPVNEDSNSLEISEKPIIDTGQVTSSPSLEDENRDDFTNKVDTFGVERKVSADDGESGEDDLDDEEEDEEDDEEGEEDQQGEEEEEEEEEEEGEVDEDEEGEEEVDEGDVTNEESSQQNTDEEDSQDTGIVRSGSIIKKVIQLDNLPKQPVLTSFESQGIRNPEPSEIPVAVKPAEKVCVSAKIVEQELKSVGIKHIETTVIKTSPIKVVNIAELTKPTADERKLDVKVPIGITLTPVTKHASREDVLDIAKPRDNLSSRSNIFFSPSNESKLGHNKISLKPIDKLAANLVKLHSEKLEKPSGIKSLEKIAENLARSSGIHGMVTSPEEDRQIPDFFTRNQVDKTAASRSQRGMDLSTSPRGWESLGDRNRAVDFSGIDLSSRKLASKVTELPSPGYRVQDFQHKEIDLSTRKPGRSDILNIPYDARTISRGHGVIADLSKRQTLPPLPFASYDIPSAYRNPVRLSNADDHRLPSYSILADPSKMGVSRLGGVSEKRPFEDDDLPQDITKRIHADIIPIRGTIDNRQIIASNWRDDIGEAIEEPIMMVHGEGSGSDCDAVNPGIGEAVDEPVIYFHGEGFGCECETGNPADETPTDGKDTGESKNEKNMNLSDSKIELKSSSTNQALTEATHDDVSSLRSSENYAEPSTSTTENLENSEICMESLESDKTKFKPTLGVQVFTKTISSPVKRLSRWDVRRPAEKINAQHDSLVSLSGVETSAKELFNFPEESENSELSTIQESTGESCIESEVLPSISDCDNDMATRIDDDESNSQTESCDINRSDDASKSEELQKESTPYFEEPCRHDSSTSMGTEPVETVTSGLLLVPEAENLDEKQNIDDISVAQTSVLKSSSHTELPCEEGDADASDESRPRFFFGPNCVSYNLKNDIKKDDLGGSSGNPTDSQTTIAGSVSSDTKQSENESIARLAEDLAKTVSIEKLIDSVPGKDSLDDDDGTGIVCTETSTDSIVENKSLDKSIVPIPNTVGTDEIMDPVSKDEGLDEETACDSKSIDLTPVNEKFEKFAVSEGETEGADQSLESISEDDGLEISIDVENEAVSNAETTDFIPVRQSFEKLAVSEAETIPTAESTECLSKNKSLEKLLDSKTETEHVDELTSCVPKSRKDDESTDRISDSKNIEETTDLIAEKKSTECPPKVKVVSRQIDYVPDIQSIEPSTDFVDDTEIAKESTDRISGVDSIEKRLEESENPESQKESTTFISDSIIHAESVEEATDSRTVDDKVEDLTNPLPIDQSVTVVTDPPKKVASVEESTDQLEAEISDPQELADVQHSESEAYDSCGENEMPEKVEECAIQSDSQITFGIPDKKEGEDQERQKVEESGVELSTGRISESQVSEELPESQTISEPELGTSINEDELLKSSSDSEQDQNVHSDKTDIEEETIWSSRSVAAEKLIDRKEETVFKDFINKDEDSGRRSLLEAIENQYKVERIDSNSELRSTSRESSMNRSDFLSQLNANSSTEKISELETENARLATTTTDKFSKAHDSISETSKHDDRSQDIKCDVLNESGDKNEVTENTRTNESLDLELKQSPKDVDSSLGDKPLEISSTEFLNTTDATEPSDDHVTEERVDKLSMVDENEEGLPKKEEFYFNQITPAAIIDSNISKSPERITIDSKNETNSSSLTGIADDYCDPASENPSSSADQDSNEAMVIDDRVYDSNESSKDVDNEDSILNKDNVVDEEQEKLPDSIVTAIGNESSIDSNNGKTSENKNEESCFNLRNMSGSPKQESALSPSVEMENKSTFQTESEVDKYEKKDDNINAPNLQASELEKEVALQLTEDTFDEKSKNECQTVEKCTIESELEEAEDIVENVTQDTSTDDTKSLVANYDSSDRESDDVFENDLLESASNADEFDDAESSELLLGKDEKDDSPMKIDESEDRVEENTELFPKSKGELSNYVQEDKMDLESTSNDQAKTSEVTADKDCLTELNVFNENTESPASNLGEITEQKTSLVKINLQKDETEQIVADDWKENIGKPIELSRDSKIKESINTEQSAEPITVTEEETKDSLTSAEEVLNAKCVAETELKSGNESEDEDEREESGIQLQEFADNKSLEKSQQETVPDPIEKIPDEKNTEIATCRFVETNMKDLNEMNELKPSENIGNSTISNLEDVKESLCKNLEKQVSEEEKSIGTNKLSVVNALLPLTIAVEHSLQLDKNDSDESNEAEDPLFEEEPPIVHHSKRFKEDSNVQMLDDDKRKLKVLSLFPKDLKKKDPIELTAGSDVINHSMDYTISTKLGESEDSGNLQRSSLDENKSTSLAKTCKETQDDLTSSENSPLDATKPLLSRDKVDKIDTMEENSDVAVILPVVTETVEIRKAADITRNESIIEEKNNKKFPELPNPEDILLLESKQMNFELLTKSQASVNQTVGDSQKFIVPPQNSLSRIMTTHLEDIKKSEANIPDNEKGEKIQVPGNLMMKNSTDTKGEDDSQMQSVDLKVVTIESDDSMGADNDDPFSNSPNEMDPLACIDDDASTKRLEANASAAALGIRVKPVSELVYEGWKLDGTETPKISRKRRNSNQESNSEDVIMKDDDDESEGTGGKRMRLRGKCPPDMNLRRTVEEKRQEVASSDDETIKKPTDVMKEDCKEADDTVVIDSVNNDKKTRGRPRGKKRVKRGIRHPGRAPPVSDTNRSLCPDSFLGTDPSAEVRSSPAISSDTPQKKRKKRKMVLGLEIGRDIVDTPGALLNETPVRQSRRIAQIKIKEEADRRRIEEETLCELKEKKDRDVGDRRKRKKQKAESEEEVSSKEIERDSKAKKKRKKKKRKKKSSTTKFDELNPWRSSSGSSSEDDDDHDEDDDEDEDVESEGSILFKSDHEFSPESDLEKDDESEPLRRARTAQKAQSDIEEADDEYACQKCGKADHPEWILLCDTCDKGWHCSCLRPALMLIPEGDWFCPPCQHNLLVFKLQENLKKYDQETKRHENELLRKKRLAFVGISLDNVLHKNETHKSSRASSQDSDNDSLSSSSSSSSGSSTSEDSEPVYQLRERRCANTYKFNEYDDMINAAIQDEVEAVRGAGNQGRGKDIATIVNAEKEEVQAEALKKNLQEVEEDEEEARMLEKDSDEDYKAEKDEDLEEEEEDEDDKPKLLVKRTLSRKKHRKLNSLDISSEDDPESDEDFKGSSSDDDEDPDDQGSSSDDSCFADTRRRGRRGGAPVRRSTRARMTRYDEDFINDDSEDSDRPKKKKSRSVWDESESEESDNSWRQRKKRSKTMPTSRSRLANKSKSKKRRKKKRVIESDNQSENNEEVEPSIKRNEFEEPMATEPIPDLEEVRGGNDKKYATQIEDAGEIEQKTEEGQEKCKEEISVLPKVEDEKLAKKKKETTPKRKKTPPIRRKIVYGGLRDSYPKQEEETLGRRTRGKKINYQEVLASDSEEELKKALKKTEESEDEFVVNEVENLNEEAEKDSDSGDIYSPKKEGPKPKGKSPKGKKPRKSKSPGAKLKPTNENETPKARKKPGPKPGSKNKPRSQKMTPPFNNPRSGGEEGDITEEGSLAGLGAGELAELDEEQLDQMMMEDEEYGKRQLELAAIEIAKKKKEEREAKKLEKARLKALEILAAERQRDPNAPEGTDGETPKKKKRGRRSKAEILAEQMRRDGAPNLSIESSSPNVTTAILSPSVNMTANPSITMTANPSVTPILSPGLTTPTLSATLNPNLSSFLNPNTGLNLAPNLTPNLGPNLSPITTPEAQKIPESLVPVIAGPDAHAFSPEGMLVKPKRRGRGKGKKTLALEAARAAEAAAKGIDHISGFGTDSNPEMKSDDPNVLPTPGSSTSGSAPSTPPASIVGVTQVTPSTQSQPPPSVSQGQNYPSMPQTQQQQSSVITRMLQSQPVSGGPQSFAAAAAAMGHKYFGAPNAAGNIMGVPRPGFDLQPRGRIPSPYRQPGQSPMPPHFAAVRSGTPPMRMRVPGPQMYHTPHHPMDPSPSGGGPISITSSRDRSSPLGPGPGPAMIPPAAGSPLTKGGPTPPPPPPYARGVPPMGRFPDSSPMGGPRHQIPPFSNPSATNHSLQQPSPPPNRAPGNFSPYHPPPPPNYHYGAYPPPPPMTTADDAAAYQGSPYPSEHFSTPSENPAPIQPPPPPQPQAQPHPHPGEPGTGNKQFDEEGTGEFGGLVSYFSSQREDDLDS